MWNTGMPYEIVIRTLALWTILYLCFCRMFSVFDYGTTHIGGSKIRRMREQFFCGAIPRNAHTQSWIVLYVLRRLFLYPLVLQKFCMGLFFRVSYSIEVP